MWQKNTKIGMTHVAFSINSGQFIQKFKHGLKMNSNNAFYRLITRLNFWILFNNASPCLITACQNKKKQNTVDHYYIVRFCFLQQGKKNIYIILVLMWTILLRVINFDNYVFEKHTANQACFKHTTSFRTVALIIMLSIISHNSHLILPLPWQHGLIIKVKSILLLLIVVQRKFLCNLQKIYKYLYRRNSIFQLSAEYTKLYKSSTKSLSFLFLLFYWDSLGNYRALYMETYII